VADEVDVGGPEGLLGRGGPGVRGLGQPEEVRDELDHPGRREQEARVGRRDQRRGGHAPVAPLLEEGEERLADLPPFHGG